MLRQMLEDAGAQLKDGKFQQALDSSRRVTQFDSTNFQAFLCVGLASLQLRQFEDSEDAFRRAAGIKPTMPAAWKNLADLFDESKQPQKKLEPLEKLVAIFRETNKVKPCQKWIAEVAATAMELKMFPKAFDAWHSLVVPQSGDAGATCLTVTPNEELPPPMAIWLDLVDLLQRASFSLADCATRLSLSDVADQFFSAAATWTPDAVAGASGKLEPAVAFFLRASLDELKAAKPATPQKTALLRKLDAQAVAVISWLPTAKIPAEFLLLRSEDSDSPITLERAASLARDLQPVYPKSPMIQVFNGLQLLEAGDPEQVQATILDALAYCSSAAFFESALCIRAQMALASVLLSARDVEGCLGRLQRVRTLLAEKAQTLGSAPPRALIYSEPRARLMEATAREYSGDFDRALAAYQAILEATDDASAGYQAAVRISELLLAKGKYAETRDALDAFAPVASLPEGEQAVLSSIRGWVQFQLGAADDAKTLLESVVPMIPATSRLEKARALTRLAIVYWHCGGAHREEKAFCFGLLLQAAKLTPGESEIFGWLGKWYDEVARDAVRAEKCFLKALALSPSNELAGVAISELYERQQQHAANVALWTDMTRDPVTAPTWALLRLAQHLVELDDELAVGKLHLVLRNDPLSTRHWVTLGHVYRHFGKVVSAYKSYLKAIELGETNWCLLCELARIEGELLVFDAALARIEPFVAARASAPSGSEQTAVVSMLYAELLFKQAKHMCAEGLYGRAAGNLVRASSLMQTTATAASSRICGSVDGLKLLGDIHSLAFYLSPSDFGRAADATSSAWVDFIAGGRKAYEAASALLAAVSGVPDTTRAAAHYSLGVSCWYESQALGTAHGINLSGFEHMLSAQSRQLVAAITAHEPALFARIQALRMKARESFAESVRACPQFRLAWNGLGVAHDHVVAKQFAWVRATEVGRNDAAWANLATLYARHPEGGAAASLAQKALIHLQGVNASNPVMWNGYGMLARREGSAAQQLKAIESFRCALEMGLDMDALQGYAAAVLLVASPSTQADGEPSVYEEVLFMTRKVLERDPFNAESWNVLGVVQHRLGLFEDSKASLARAQLLLSKTPWYDTTATRAQLKWNCSVAALGCDDTALDFEAARGAAAPTRVLGGLLDAQQLYHRSDPARAVQALSALLQSDLTSDERDVVSTVGLAIAGLTATDDRVAPSDVDALRVRCKEHLVRALSVGISSATLRVVEMHDRVAGLTSEALALVEAASAADKPPPSTWPRLAFALIDCQQVQKTALLADAISAATKHPGAEAASVACLRALASILLTSAVDRRAQTLVRLQPWNPYAYALAGAALLKRGALAPDSDADDSRQRSLRSAALLLENGLRVTSPQAFERALVQWMLSMCYAALGDAERATECVADAQAQLDAEALAHPSRAPDFELWGARVQSVVSPLGGAKTYQAVLARVAAASAPERLVAVLSELGAVYEDAGYLDCAFQVWKAVASLSHAGGVTEAPPVAGSFLANLRLAVVHGKKQNAKAAKKQIKAAVALAPSPESAQATVAAFVEGVIAKSV
ncbi:hypothetical protein PybrP1_002477 [[Pythium] brassicae (nom. inval.)]|nr:hypothetical protein PybrP1_002477 [[Pythium] brassicae (nom. inval.)]